MAGRSQLAAAESMGVEIFVRPHPPNCSSPKIYAALDSGVMSNSSPAPGDALKRHKGRLREFHLIAISAHRGACCLVLFTKCGPMPIGGWVTAVCWRM